MGAVRTFWITPRLGAMAAVSLEAPLMLAASWLVCRVLMSRLSPGEGPGPRLLMGASAFLLLQMTEFGLSAALGRTPVQFLAGFLTAAGMICLATQVAFGLMPLALRPNILSAKP